jgi:hypothetical protein
MSCLKEFLNPRAAKYDAKPEKVSNKFIIT